MAKVNVNEASAPPAFDERERQAWDAIVLAYSAILDLGLAHNIGELTASVHALQGFVIQHMLHRLNPVEFNDWFEGFTER